MANTYTNLLYHIVFSTKDRVPVIDADWCSRLHEYLGGTVNGLDGITQGVGGTADHVHLLVGLRSTHCLADFMRELKKAGSVWVHDEIGISKFAWQEGYGAFTVSPTACKAVKTYIANLEEHHRVKSFREEFVEFLGQQVSNTIRNIWIERSPHLLATLRVALISFVDTGGVARASLNHRLIAATPPASVDVDPVEAGGFKAM